jgi:alpha-glucosidase
MFFEFPLDATAAPMDTQVMLGRALLVAPVLEEGATTVDVYFPTPATWFDYFSGAPLPGAAGTTVTIDAPIFHIPVFLRGGSIVAQQDPGNTTANQAANPVRLLVAFDSTNGTAQGWYWTDDGVMIGSAEAGK